MTQQVGSLSANVIAALGLPLQAGQPILLGSGNISHMMNRHPGDYAKYGQYIPTILANPDYVGQNPSDGSIEYVKDFQVNGEYVKVAVRLLYTAVINGRWCGAERPECGAPAVG